MAAERKPAPDLEQVILTLLHQRSAGASICPSDAARAARTEGWRALMDDVRSAAARLAGRGEVEVTQRGHKVDPGTARGPIRIRFPQLLVVLAERPVDEPDVVLGAGAVLGHVAGRLALRVVRMPHRQVVELLEIGVDPVLDGPAVLVADLGALAPGPVVAPAQQHGQDQDDAAEDGEDDHEIGQTSWTQPDSPRRRASWRPVIGSPHFSQVLPLGACAAWSSAAVRSRSL
ncbi:MAG: DUF3253 domain-containing protein [Actinobacteria bacterium]|nr:DUF3253 domain-containing protein [Actinomycetota bacterium]